jgi:hypothetical protein
MEELESERERWQGMLWDKGWQGEREKDDGENTEATGKDGIGGRKCR